MVHRKELEAIALELRHQRPLTFSEYQEADQWNRGTYDEWATIVLGLCKTFTLLMGYDANGNYLFKRDKFLTACGYNE